MSLLTVLLLAILPLVPFAIIALQPGFRWISPISVMAILISFGATIPYVFKLSNDLHTEEYFLLGGTDRYYLNGVIMLSLGTLAFSFGTLYGKRRSYLAPKVTFTPNPIYTPLYYGVAALAVILMIYYFYALGILENLLSGQFIIKRFLITDNGDRTSVSFAGMGLDMLYVVMLSRVAATRSFSLPSIVFALGIILAQLLVGGRFSLLLYVIGIMIVLQIIHAREVRSRLGIYALIGAGLLSVQIVTALRGAGSTGAQGTSLLETIESGTNQTLTQIYERPYFIGMDKLAVIHDRTRFDEPLYGASIFSLVYAPIPRLLWPNKPSVRLGQYVGSDIYGRDSLSGIPPSIVGELYLNFRWFGVAIGMFLFGMLSTRMYEYGLAGAGRDPFPAVVYSIYSTAFLFNVTLADFNGGAISFIVMYVTFWFARKHYYTSDYYRRLPGTRRRLRTT